MTSITGTFALWRSHEITGDEMEMQSAAGGKHVTVERVCFLNILFVIIATPIWVIFLVLRIILFFCKCF